MTLHYNRHKDREKRRLLRRNATGAETELWKYLRRGQLGVRFRRQYSVDGYVLDFYAPQSKLAIEVDGECHLEDEAKEYDAARTVLLNQFGIEVLRFTNAEVMTGIENVLERIEGVLRGRTTSL